MRVIITTRVIKKILLPSACASLGAAAVGQSSDGEKKGEKVLVRPRDLPIYSTEPVKEKCEPKPSSTDSAITSTVRQIREGTWAMLDQMKVLTNQACDVIETGKAHTSSTITFLREEENAIPRYGAIGLGGLAGLLLSFRRGIFKRLLYTTTGAVGMAALLYPQEAREYSADGIKIAKKYIIVGYHFINGVLRDYTGMQLPALPEPLSMNSTSAEKEVSGAMLPPSHIPSGAIPLPPIDAPPSKKGK